LPPFNQDFHSRVLSGSKYTLDSLLEDHPRRVPVQIARLISESASLPDLIGPKQPNGSFSKRLPRHLSVLHLLVGRFLCSADSGDVDFLASGATAACMHADFNVT